jgi:hypothetical protein
MLFAPGETWPHQWFIVWECGGVYSPAGFESRSLGWTFDPRFWLLHHP